MNKAVKFVIIFSLVLVASAFSTHKAWAFNLSEFTSQTVPTTMDAGQLYTVTLNFTNTGSDTWQPSFSCPQGTCDYALGSQDPQDNGTWSVGRVAVPSNTPTGYGASFTFQVLAPSTPGTYNFQWRMVEDPVEWFGDFSTALSINVITPPADDAEYISQSVPTSMTAGQSYAVSVTMKDTGTNNWSVIGAQINAYRLRAEDPTDNTTWGSSREELPSTVASGGQVTISFNVTAPGSAGTYDFQWRMVLEGHYEFGDFTPDVSVTVAAGPPTIDLKANGSDGPITIPYNTAATITWTSTNTLNCNVLGHGGPSGSFSTGNLTSNTTFSGQCFGNGPNANDSVTVNVPAPTCNGITTTDTWVTATSGTELMHISGVTNASDVTFGIVDGSFSEFDDSASGVVNDGGGVWHYNFNLADLPTAGTIYVYGYAYNAAFGWVGCSGVNPVSFARLNTGTINVNSNVPTSWTITCTLTSPACPSVSSGANQTSGSYATKPDDTWTITPAAIPGYTVTVTPSITQPLQ